MGSKLSQCATKTDSTAHCCDKKCISQIKHLQDLVTTRRQSAWTLTDEHRITLRSAISNANLPVIISQIISSYLDYIAAEYLMIHHRAVNDYFGGAPVCTSLVRELTVGLLSKSEDVGDTDVTKSKRHAICCQ